MCTDTRRLFLLRLLHELREDLRAQPLRAEERRIVAARSVVLRLHEHELQEIRPVLKNERPLCLDVGVGVDDVIGVVLERLLGEAFVEALLEQALAKTDRMTAGPRDAAVCENRVDARRPIVGMPNGRALPRQVAQELHIEDAVAKVVVDEALVVSFVVEAEIVVVCLAERRRDMLAGEIDDLLGWGASVLFALGEAQSAIVDEHSRATNRSPVNHKPLSKRKDG